MRFKVKQHHVDNSYIIKRRNWTDIWNCVHATWQTICSVKYHIPYLHVCV